MSKKGTLAPEPGEKIKAASELVNRIIDKVQHYVESTDPKDTQALEEVLQQAPEILGMNPDYYQMVIRALVQLSSKYQEQSDLIGYQAYVLCDSVSKLEKQVIDYIESHDGVRLDGETWSFQLVDESPEIFVNPETLRDFAPQYEIQKSSVNDVLIKEHIDQGITIPGVEVHKKKGLVANVLKKEVRT